MKEELESRGILPMFVTVCDQSDGPRGEGVFLRQLAI